MRFSSLRAIGAASLFAFSTSLFGAPKIGVLLKAQDIPFWKAVEQGADQAAKELGADVTVKAPLKETDVSVQIRLLNAMAGQGMQAIVIAPINKEALARPIASIAVSGVKIVVIDTAITGKAAPVFIGTDQQAAGKAGGDLLASLVTDKDEVAFFKHSQASGATVDRDAGALAGFRASRPNAVIHGDIYASSEPGLEKQKAELLLKEYPHVKAILATGTAGTLAMLDVLKAQNLAGSIKLVGFGFNLTPDVASAIESGALTGWIAQLPKEMGSKGVATAVSLLKGETVAPVINTDFVVITKGNLKEPKVQALLAM
jgi:ribose transport system substrate-binding protein